MKLAMTLKFSPTAGVDHVLIEPAERELADWLRAVERVAREEQGIQP